MDWTVTIGALVTTLTETISDVLTASWGIFAILAGISIVFMILRKVGVHR